MTRAKITMAEHIANWKDPRSVAFRATIDGWVHHTRAEILLIAERAEEHAWLPEHYDLLRYMRQYGGTKEPSL